MALPIGVENTFKGIFLLLERKAIIWQGDETGAKYTVSDEIPNDMKDEVEAARAKLVEAIAETDDKLIGDFLEGKEISITDLKAALRQATCDNIIVPVFPGSSLRNKGVQPLLDAIVDFLPSPLDRGAVIGINPNTNVEETRKPELGEPFAGLAFKIQADSHVGRLTYIRIYSGTLKQGSFLYNPGKRERERVGRILLMHSNDREEIESAGAGEIVAVIGMKSTKTGDTLCDENKPIILESITFPEPVISLAIEPKTKADQEKLGMALNKLSDEDPTFQIRTDHETGQTVISGMGELHLEVLVERLRREFKVDASTGTPQVAYRETITKEASGEGKYIRQSGGRGQYGHCVLIVRPKTRGEGYLFNNKIVGGTIPKEFIAPIEKGVRECLANGIIAGFPLVDIEVDVVDGSYHEVDSPEMSFKIAGPLGAQAAVKQAKPVILEPIMKVEVTTPEDYLGDIIGDISSRRAQIQGTIQRGNARVVVANVPL